MDTTNVDELRNKESTVKLKLEDWSMIGVSLTYILDAFFNNKKTIVRDEWTQDEANRLFKIVLNIYGQHVEQGHMDSIEKIIRNKIETREKEIAEEKPEECQEKDAKGHYNLDDPEYTQIKFPDWEKMTLGKCECCDEPFNKNNPVDVIQRCHPKARILISYWDGMLYFTCAECDKPIIKTKIDKSLI